MSTHSYSVKMNETIYNTHSLLVDKIYYNCRVQ